MVGVRNAHRFGNVDAHITSVRRSQKDSVYLRFCCARYVRITVSSQIKTSSTVYRSMELQNLNFVTLRFPVFSLLTDSTGLFAEIVVQNKEVFVAPAIEIYVSHFKAIKNRASLIDGNLKA